jgi:hypothetical protein
MERFQRLAIRAEDMIRPRSELASTTDVLAMRLRVPTPRRAAKAGAAPLFSFFGWRTDNDQSALADSGASR